MSAIVDRGRERWERMNEREQRLVAALGITLVVCIVVFMVSRIQKGMEELEAKNEESRKALTALAIYRNAKANAGSQVTSSSVKIPETALALDSYLEKIISELELASPTYPALKTNKVGEYEELSFEVSLKGLDMEQLSQVLERVESGSKLVVFKDINIDQNFRDKEKLNLQFTLATYRQAKQEKQESESESEGS